MTGGPERKYTDRDVRENPDFDHMVEDYLRSYEGEFEFLIDNKMRVAQGTKLTVGMVRGVLNCMRHDPRVTDLPEPLPQDEVVVQMRPKKRQRYDSHHCGDKKSHERHWDDAARETCHGTPFPINRTFSILMDAHVKKGWVKAPGGTLLHEVDPTVTHKTVWHLWGNEHGYGPRELDAVHVKTLCRYPSWVNAGSIMDIDEASDLNDCSPDVGFCPHCQSTRSALL